VGCGDGTLVEELRALGFDARGIDVKEPSSAFCAQIAVEDFVVDEPFDAVVARLSLHHTNHLGAVFERIRAALPSGGTLVVQEFAWTAFSPKTISWVREQTNAPGPEPRTVDLWSGSPAEVVRRWIARYGELHTMDAILFAADAFFARRDLTPVPYVSWLIDLPELVEAESDALGNRLFPPLGFVYAGEAL
jgi:SAM-dependent methyltransferase